MSEQIRNCPACNQPVTINTGLNSENWKKLWRWPTVQEWIILFMLLMVILLAFAYRTETAQARSTLKNLPAICAEYNNNNFDVISEKYNINITNKLPIYNVTIQKEG